MRVLNVWERYREGPTEVAVQGFPAGVFSVEVENADGVVVSGPFDMRGPQDDGELFDILFPGPAVGGRTR